MRADTLQGQVGGGLGPGNRDFFEPWGMASSRKASAIWGPKNSRFTATNMYGYPWSPLEVEQVLEARH
jgi:hypothetical protein